MCKKEYLLLILIPLKLFSQNLDLKILRDINAKSYPAWDEGMKGVSNSVIFAMPVSPVVTFVIGKTKKNEEMQRNAFCSAAAIGVALGVSTGLKYIVNRTRPFTEYPNEIIQRDKDVGPYSFPSGHSTSAFVMATTLSLSYKKWYVTVPAYAYASLVAYSRMRLGVHYPSDVLAGMVIGSGSAFLVWNLDKKIKKSLSKK